MALFDERPASSPAQQRLRVGLPLLLGAVCLGFWMSYQPHQWQQEVKKFRGEMPLEPGPNLSMDSSLRIRRFLLTHRSISLSPSQGAALIASVNEATDDQAQSEALDVLSLAKRLDALSPGQAQSAGQATLQVLTHSPGPMVRLESARLLGHLGSLSGIPALRLLQRDTDPKIREAAAGALVRLQR